MILETAKRMAGRLRRKAAGLLGQTRPDFLVIGVMKGGSSLLRTVLQQHPALYLPNEPINYFSGHSDRGSKWYSCVFDAARPFQKKGEVTPYYLFHSEAPARIHSLIPRVKLVVMARDPVRRTISQYFHSLKHGREDLSLAAALEAESDRLSDSHEAIRFPGGQHAAHQHQSYLARSRYEEQLPRYMSLFGSDQLLVLKSEDFFENPEYVAGRIYDFLGVPPVRLAGPITRVNAGTYADDLVDEAIRLRLREQLAPTYEWMREHYGFSWSN